MSRRIDPRPDPIARAAAEWIVRLRDPAVSARERAEFSEWIHESPVHVREYLAAAEVWGILRNAKAWPTDSTEDIISAARGAAAVVAISSDGPIRRLWRHRMGIGRLKAGAWLSAMAILVAAVGTFTLLQYRPRSGDIDISTVRGEQRTLDLSDGTVARFNTLTRAVIHYDAHIRRIELSEGEAFFRVEHDPKRPFEVVTPFATVRDVGTEFDVYSSSHDTRVAVVEGRVRVTHPVSWNGIPARAEHDGAHQAGLPAVSLAANQVLIVGAGGAETRVAISGASPIATAWLGNRIILDNQRLDAAIAEFNRYNSLQISLSQSGLGSLRISGVFDATDPQALLTYLERIRGLRLTRSPNHVVIGPQEP